ncbi:MAG: hypothetical protein HYY93_05165 [Planctomycetes bacterium]|nr:hypothetical protein [Planctomycetota bacterium]
MSIPLRTGLFAALVLVLSATPLRAQEEEPLDDVTDGVYWTGGARFNLWLGQSYGNIRVDDDNNAIEGTKIDIHDEMDLEQTAAGYTVEVHGGWDDHRITLNYSRISFEGSRDIRNTFRYGGRTFSPGRKMDASLRFQDFNLLYEYALYPAEDLTISPLVGVDWRRIGAQIQDSTQEVSEDINIPTPVLGLRVRIDFYRMFSLEGEFHGMALGLNKVSGSMFNSTVRLSAELTMGLRLYIGHHYEYLSFDADAGDTSAIGTLNAGGLIFGVEWEF